MIVETDAAGNFVGSSYSYATARDWARFGLLYYQDGIWKGDTILPKGWVAYTRTPAPASKGEYGAHFWLNQSKVLPDAPEDLFSCEGHHGQRVFIIPSRNLVIVRLGFSEEAFGHNEFVKGILAAIKKN
jgi:CubicO group peptidase (beta-lactamase class C family)